MILINLIISIIILYFTFKIAFKISKKYKLNYLITLLIISWHILISMCYFFLSFSKRTDAEIYFQYSFLGQLGQYNQIQFYEFKIGSNFIYEFIRFFTSNFYFDYLNLFFFFNFFGTVGLLLIYIKCIEVIKHNKFNYFLLFSIIFLPSMSFWSSAPGKDALSFLIISLCLFSFNKKYYYIYFPLLSFLMFIIRPHIGIVLFISFAIAFIIKIKVNFYYKIAFVFINFIILFFTIDFVLSFINFNNSFSLNGIIQFLENRERASFIGNTKIDLFDSNSFVKIYHYLFTPSLLYYNNNGILYLLQSIENTFLLMIMSFMLIKIILNLINFKIKIKDIISFENIFIMLTSLVLLIVLSHTTLNSGIATRQKYIFIPLLLYLFLKLSNTVKR